LVHTPQTPPADTNILTASPAEVELIESAGHKGFPSYSYDENELVFHPTATAPKISMSWFALENTYAG